MVISDNHSNGLSKILIVDDNTDALYVLESALISNGYQVVIAESGDQALKIAEEITPSVVLLDVMMPGINGIEVVKHFKNNSQLRFVPIILVTGKDSLDDVIKGLDSGADGYIAKPYRPEELFARLRAALRLRSIYDELRASQERNEYLTKQLTETFKIETIIGSSRPMQEVLNLVEKVAKVDSPVLICGASGVGKELVARAIHFKSENRNYAFVAKNCATFNEHLLESELFGHVRGSFTGAIKDQIGLFETADKGTLFLDEIGEMSLSLQAKLLRVLQEQIVVPVGSREGKKVNVRIIAATNRNLLQMIEEGTFREDLYFRLNVVTINIPPLSQRKEDIPALVNRFMQTYSKKLGKILPHINEEVMEALQAYHWKGNVRELQNEIERILILWGDENEFLVEMLSPHIRQLSSKIESHKSRQKSLKSAVENTERKIILDSLKQHNWNKSVTAKELGISRSNLINKVQYYNLTE